MNIGIIGPIGAGKDTFAELLSEALGPDDCYITGFAQPGHAVAEALRLDLRRESKEEVQIHMYPCFGEELQQAIAAHIGYLTDNQQAELYARFIDAATEQGLLRQSFGDVLAASPRQFLRLFLNCGRQVDSNLWNDALDTRSIGHKFTIIPDVRYPAEYEGCYWTIAVHRKGHEWAPEAHESEQYGGLLAAKADIHVFNDDDIEALVGTARAVARDILGE